MRGPGNDGSKKSLHENAHTKEERTMRRCFRLVGATVVALALCAAASAASPLWLEVTPQTTHVGPGEDLWFTVDIVNLTDTTVAFDGWVDVYLPNGNPYSGNPVIGTLHLNLGGGAGVYGVERNLHIPPGAPHGGPYELCVRTGEHPDLVWAEDCFGFYVGSPADYLIWEPDPTPISGQAIKDGIEAAGYTAEFVMESLGDYNLFDYDGLFVCLGMYPNNYQIMEGSPEAFQIEDYIAGGGNVYMEGGDVWYYDPLVGGHDFGPSFGIVGIGDGGADLYEVTGVDNPIMPGLGGLTSPYFGENSFVDCIEPAPTRARHVTMREIDWHYDIQVGGLHIEGGGSVGGSFELGGTLWEEFIRPTLEEILQWWRHL